MHGTSSMRYCLYDLVITLVSWFIQDHTPNIPTSLPPWPKSFWNVSGQAKNHYCQANYSDGQPLSTEWGFNVDVPHVQKHLSASIRLGVVLFTHGIVESWFDSIWIEWEVSVRGHVWKGREIGPAVSSEADGWNFLVFFQWRACQLNFSERPNSVLISVPLDSRPRTWMPPPDASLQCPTVVWKPRLGWSNQGQEEARMRRQFCKPVLPLLLRVNGYFISFPIGFMMIVWKHAYLVGLSSHCGTGEYV